MTGARLGLAVAAGLMVSACASGDWNVATLFDKKDRAASGSSVSRVSVDVPDLEQLANRDPAYVSRFLGPPEVRRAEAGAEFWTYTNSRCRLYMIFYEQLGGGQRLHHVESEALGDDGGDARDRLQACVGAAAASYQTAPRETAGTTS